MFHVSNFSFASQKKLVLVTGVIAFFLVIGVGVFAKNGWLPSSDSLSGKRTGWFGKELPKNAPSSWNPITAALPTATPTPLPLTKENIYAGSRLVSVVDSNALDPRQASMALAREAVTQITLGTVTPVGSKSLDMR